jgi:hypothetical protein
VIYLAIYLYFSGAILVYALLSESGRVIGLGYALSCVLWPILVPVGVAKGVVDGFRKWGR